MIAFFFRWYRAITQRKSLLRVRCGELADENAALRQQIAERDSQLRVRDLEIEELTLVIERNRQRVQSELGSYAAAMVDAERPTDNGAQPWRSRTAS